MWQHDTLKNIQDAFYLLFILKSLNCSVLSKRLITTRQRRKIHPPWKNRKWEMHFYKESRRKKSWCLLEKKINYEIKRWERCRQFHLLLQAHRITRRDNTERHIIEVCTTWMYLEELKSTQPRISPTLYISVCPRGWCCKSDTSAGFDMVLNLT